MEFLDRIRSRAQARRTGTYLGDRLGKSLCFVQGDQNIANQAGAAFRSDLNNELQALVTFSQGASAPGTTYRNMTWHDTTANVKKRRNAANAAWIVEGTLDETFVLSRSSNTILGLSDIGKTIAATSTFTQTLTAAATLGDGWWCEYRNDGTGIITIDPNGAETIDGATTIFLYTGESCVINCNGAAFKTVGRGTGRVLIQKQTASTSASLDFTIGITSDFDSYELDLTNILPATNGVQIYARVTEDGGSSWKAGASDYGYSDTGAGSGTSETTGANTGTAIVLNSSVDASNVSSNGLSGTLKLFAPSSAAVKKVIKLSIGHVNAGANTMHTFDGMGAYIGTTNAINGVRIIASSGNLASGSVALYGNRKS